MLDAARKFGSGHPIFGTILVQFESGRKQFNQFGGGGGDVLWGPVFVQFCSESDIGAKKG